MFAILLFALRLGTIAAGSSLGENYLVTSVQARPEAIHVRVKTPSGEIVTYGLDRSKDEGLLDLDGTRLFYVGNRIRSDAIVRGGELLAESLRKSELVGAKLQAAIAENTKAAKSPWQVDPDVAESILRSLEGTWKTDGNQQVVRTRSEPTVLQEEKLRFIGYDKTNRVFWILKIEETGGVTYVPGEWNADEQRMEFAGRGPEEGSTQSVVLRIVNPTRHVFEKYLTKRGQAPSLQQSATFERSATP